MVFNVAHLLGGKKFGYTRGILLSFLSAVFLGLIFLSLVSWWFVWVALVPFFLMFRLAPSMSSALILTMIFGATYGVVVSLPLFRLTTVWWGGSFLMSYDALIAVLLVLAVALYGSIFFLAVAYVGRTYQVSRMRDVLLVAFIWALVEYVRSHYVLAGYGWGDIGYALVDATYIRAIARFFGVYGLSFLVITVNMLLVLTYERMSENTLKEFKRVLREFIVLPTERLFTALLLCIWFSVVGYGVWESTVALSVRSTPLHAALLVAGSDDPSASGGLYRAYRQNIIQLLALHPDMSIVLFPENTFPFFQIDEETKALAMTQTVQLSERDVLYQDFLSLSRKYSATIFAVGLHTIKSGHTYNTLVFYQDGKIVDMLHKEELVPFFEYAPLGLPIPIFEPLTEGAPGQKIIIGGDAVGMLMCSEVGHDNILSSKVSLVLSPSNDGVFISTRAGHVQDMFARMRAIESGAYLVRANKGSVSSIISPKGEVLETSLGDTVLFRTLD